MSDIFEERHAADAAKLDYGEECVIPLASGATVRCPTFENDPSCTYVRVCDSEEREIAYWIVDEWAEDPSLVMGAILGAMKGAS